MTTIPHRTLVDVRVGQEAYLHGAWHPIIAVSHASEEGAVVTLAVYGHAARHVIAPGERVREGKSLA